ncbi:MAG: hypothetical protein ACYCTI_04875 [Acidimicrobiales bacterium]
MSRLLDVLRRVGYGDIAASQWWDETKHEELGGHTAAEAWIAGDQTGVRRVVETLASCRLADALSESPRTVDRLLKQAPPS